MLLVRIGDEHDELEDLFKIYDDNDEDFAWKHKKKKKKGMT